MFPTTTSLSKGASTVQASTAVGATVLTALATILLLTVNHTRPELALLPAAFVFGLTQVGGLCGAAHVNTMACLSRMRRSMWLRAVTAYTLGGVVSSAAVGIGAAAVGEALRLPDVAGAVIVLGLVLAGREFGLVSFRIPELVRQTNRTWAYDFGWTRAAAMWGFHIGMGMATVITFGSYWLLVAICLTSRAPIYGAMLMITYWLGRCAPLWLPVFVLQGRATFDINVWLPSLRAVNGCLLLLVALTQAVLLFRG